jgi:ferredoxin
MKVEADRDRCIGAGMCVMTAEEVFDQDDDGVVVVLPARSATAEVPPGHAAAVARAVASCPAGALRTVDG